MRKPSVLLCLLGSLVLPSYLTFNEYGMVEAAIGTTPPTSYANESYDNYYDSIQGLTSDDLLNGLATLSQEKHRYQNTYDENRGGNAYSDANPDGSSTFIDIYTGWEVPNDWDSGTTWNREHLWCVSLSGGLYTRNNYSYASSY